MQYQCWLLWHYLWPVSVLKTSHIHNNSGRLSTRQRSTLDSPHTWRTTSRPVSQPTYHFIQSPPTTQRRHSSDRIFDNYQKTYKSYETLILFVSTLQCFQLFPSVAQLFPNCPLLCPRPRVLVRSSVCGLSGQALAKSLSQSSSSRKLIESIFQKLTAF